MKKIAYFLTMFFILTGLTFKGEHTEFPKPLPTTEGQLIFEEMQCAMCHGHQGMGDGFLAGGLDPKPRNFNSYEEMLRVPYQSMYTAMKDGVPYTGMPSFDLSDSQINSVISYIKSFLTESYITLSTCSNVPKVISLENINVGGQFKIEKDKGTLVTTSLKEGELTISPNFYALRRTYNKKQAKLVRVHVSLTKKSNGKKKYLAIIALRIKNCIK
jgi:hypothetical protein